MWLKIKRGRGDLLDSRFNPAIFFQILQVSDSVAGVLICDVMGHGVRAALVAAILRALVEDLRAHASEPARFFKN